MSDASARDVARRVAVELAGAGVALGLGLGYLLGGAVDLDLALLEVGLPIVLVVIGVHLAYTSYRTLADDLYQVGY